MTASRRSDHTDATRRALVDAGRYLFARRDYGDVSIEDIVTRARVTRGALDYHFDSKKDLFQTVLEVVEADLVADVEAAIAKVTDAWICWSSASTPSLTRRPNRMRCRSLRLTARQCSGGANGAGSTCARAWSAGRGSRTRDAAGVIQRVPLPPLSHLLLAALTESALQIADATDKDRTRVEVERAFMALLEGLRV